MKLTKKTPAAPDPSDPQSENEKLFDQLFNEITLGVINITKTRKTLVELCVAYAQGASYLDENAKKVTADELQKAKEDALQLVHEVRQKFLQAKNLITEEINTTNRSNPAHVPSLSKKQDALNTYEGFARGSIKRMQEQATKCDAALMTTQEQRSARLVSQFKAGLKTKGATV